MVPIGWPCYHNYPIGRLRHQNGSYWQAASPEWFLLAGHVTRMVPIGWLCASSKPMRETESAILSEFISGEPAAAAESIS